MSRLPEKKEKPASAKDPSTRQEDNGKDKAQIKVIREALLQKRAAIARQQATQLNELYNPDKHHLADLEEMASDTSDTDSLCAMVDLGSSTIEQIDTALQKLDDGTYGMCEMCEEPIHPDRLEVLPFASLCVNCQRKKELNKELARADEES